MLARDWRWNRDPIQTLATANPRAAPGRILSIVQEVGRPALRIAIVEGDDLTRTFSVEALRARETGGTILATSDNVVSANAYMGAAGIAQALDQGAGSEVGLRRSSFSQVAFEVGECAIVRRSLVRGPQDYARCLARFGTNHRRASIQRDDSGGAGSAVMPAEQCRDLTARVLKCCLGRRGRITAGGIAVAVSKKLAPSRQRRKRCALRSAP